MSRVAIGLLFLASVLSSSAFAEEATIWRTVPCDGTTTDVVAFAGNVLGEAEWSVSISMRSPRGRDLLYIESPDKKVFRIAVENGRFVMSGDLPMAEAVRRYEMAHDAIMCPKPEAKSR